MFRTNKIYGNRLSGCLAQRKEKTGEGCCQQMEMVFFQGKCSKINSGRRCISVHILKVIKRVHFSTGRESQYYWEVGAGGLRVQGQIGLHITKSKIIPVTPGNRVFLQTE